MRPYSPLQIAVKIAEALEEAHEPGIVHRDLKPANIEVSDESKVKVLDFGLAKAFVEETPEADGSMSPTITRDATRVGVILGTGAYMSPEQAKGKRVDKRTDIFAFGSLLFEMLTGKKAFQGEDVSEVLAAVIRAEPDLEQLPAETPTGIRRVLHRALTKDVRNRLAAVTDARLEIVGADGSEGAASPPQATATRHPLAWLLVTLGVAALSWLAGRSFTAPNAAITRYVVTLPEGDVLNMNTGGLAVSPDGRRLAGSE